MQECAQGGMRLCSPAFQDGDSLPQLYTGDGLDLSPPLTWVGKNKLFGPYGIDDFQDLLEQNKQLIPNLSRYKNFFSGNSYKELIRYRTK